MTHTLRKLVLGAALGVMAMPLAMRAQDYRYVSTQSLFTDEQLDNLVAPVALYPDPILAQLLIAATFPDQVDLAARFVRSHGTRDIDVQPWDVSVKAIAHYPPVLNMLADRDDWTTALGQAYAEQSADVMDAVQRLREMARAEGNLVSTDQQTVIEDGRYIRIVPAQPRVIYVPTYDPAIVYYRPIFHVGYYSGYWSFGIGFPIGSWLSYDCDWYARRVYYDGWRGGGWRVAAYPYIVVNTVYVHPRYEVVYVNRNVWGRNVDYGRFNRYNTVHRTVVWTERRSGGPGPIQRAGNDGRRDGGYDGRRDDGRVGSNDGRRDDGRTTQGRDQNGRGQAAPRQAQPRDNNARDNNARDNNARDNNARDNNARGNNGRDDIARSSRPPIVERREPAREPARTERQAPQIERPQIERRPTERPQAERPQVERRNPTVERREAPPAVERRTSPPAVERRSSPPAVERRSAPPSVERRSSPPQSQGRSAPQSQGRPAQSRGQEQRGNGNGRRK